MKRLLLILTMAPVQAGAFDLALPVDCTLGETCFIQNYFDRDAGPEATDFTCGPLTYDGHDGTDFALHTDAAMEEGVPVLAAADGTVRGIRDGMPDIRISDPAAPPLDGRDCGNGVAIDHGDGWETQYCHMKEGSISVQEGQTVKRGDPLGMIGLSGNTEFPHVHLEVRKDGAELDPFDPDNTLACGEPPAPALWTAPMAYVPGGIISTGFATDVPEYDAVKAGLPDAALTPDAPAIVLWAHLFGGRVGDVVTFSISGPDGSIIEEPVTLERTQAQLLRAVG
ncbi:MAG: M23 family metallopeptidase, partial [Paracoccaceae bacterium]